MKKINEKQKKILAITGCAAGAIAATFGVLFAIGASYQKGRKEGANELADNLNDWLQDEDCDTKLELMIKPSNPNLGTNVYFIRAKYVDGKLQVRLTE